MKHDQVIAQYIKEHEIKRFVEVGVFRSYFMTAVLKSVGHLLREYWAVDPFQKDIGFESMGPHRNHDQEEWEGWYLKACRRITKFSTTRLTVHVLRTTSARAATLFRDGYFDFVYLDAAHDYTNLIQDNEVWFPKIRVGGFIGGHDYGHPRFPGVKIAVDRLYGDRAKVERARVWVMSKTGKSGLYSTE